MDENKAVNIIAKYCEECKRTKLQDYRLLEALKFMLERDQGTLTLLWYGMYCKQIHRYDISIKCFKRVLKMSELADCGFEDYGETTDDVVANTELGIIYANHMEEFYDKKLALKYLEAGAKSKNSYSKKMLKIFKRKGYINE